MSSATDKIVIKRDLFYVSHLDPLSEDDLSCVESFLINRDTGNGLLNYLKYGALKDELSHEMRTYLVKDINTNECVSFFSLKAGLISINEKVHEVNAETESFQKDFDTIPGIELANFAINSAYIKNHPKLKGIGKYIFGAFILPLARHISGLIGVKLIYIFALPYDELIKRYRTYGFNTLSDDAENKLHKRLKPRYDRFCRFMYMLLY